MLTRVVNMNVEPYDVRIDRRSHYGNSFVLGRDGNRQAVIEQHMALWRLRLANERQRQTALAMLQALKGKRLGCHCAPLPCHGNNYVTLIAEFCP